MDALAPVGVKHIDMPASPHRVWSGDPVGEARLTEKPCTHSNSTSAKSVADAAAMLGKTGGKALAGGQSLVAAMKLRLAQPGARRRPVGRRPS